LPQRASDGEILFDQQNECSSASAASDPLGEFAALPPDPLAGFIGEQKREGKGRERGGRQEGGERRGRQGGNVRGKAGIGEWGRIKGGGRREMGGRKGKTGGRKVAPILISESRRLRYHSCTL